MAGIEYEALLRLKATDETAEAVRAASKSMKEMTDQMTRASRQMDTDLKSIGKGFREMRRVALVGGAAKILGDAIQKTATLRERMVRLKIDAQLSDQQVERTEKQMRDLARTTATTVEEVTEGFNTWRVSSGQAYDDALKSYDAIVKAAVVAKTEAANVASLMGTLTNRVKVAGTDQGKALDYLRETQRELNQDYGEFGTNLESYAEGMAKIGLTGVEGLQQVLALISGIQKQTGNASETWRIFGEVFGQATDSKFLAERLGPGGMQKWMKQAIAETGSLEGALNKMNDTFGGGATQMSNAFKEKFGSETAKVLEGLKSGAIDVETAIKNLDGAIGRNEKDFKDVGDSEAAQIRRLVGELNELMTALGAVGLKINEAFGTGSQSVIQQTIGELRQLAEIIDAISKADIKGAAVGIGKFAGGLLGKGWTQARGISKTIVDTALGPGEANITDTNPNPGDDALGSDISEDLLDKSGLSARSAQQEAELWEKILRKMREDGDGAGYGGGGGGGGGGGATGSYEGGGGGAGVSSAQTPTNESGGGAPGTQVAASGDIPANILAKAKEAALTGGPGAVDRFLRENNYPRSGPWCGQFAASVIKSTGGTPPKGQAIASNWRNWGVPVSDPQPGDVAIRKGRAGGGGYVPTGSPGSHVTFVESVNPSTGRFGGVGGNQGRGQANISNYRTAAFEYRRAPSETPTNENPGLADAAKWGGWAASLALESKVPGISSIAHATGRAASGAEAGMGAGDVLRGVVPGIGVLETIKQDAAAGHPLRTKLRSALGIEDPGEPAPWQNQIPAAMQQHQPGQTQFKRRRDRGNIDREYREGRWNSYSDTM